MPRLTETEFKATMGPEPERVGWDEPPPFDFWPYLADALREDFGDFDFTAGEISYVWNMPGGRYQHVLLNSQDPNVFLVLVLDLIERQVHGHHLLDLAQLYGQR